MDKKHLGTVFSYSNCTCSVWHASYNMLCRCFACKELIKVHQWVSLLHRMASFSAVSNLVKYFPGNQMEHFWQKKFIQIIHFFMWENSVWVARRVQSHSTATVKLKGNGIFSLKLSEEQILSPRKRYLNTDFKTIQLDPSATVLEVRNDGKLTVLGNSSGSIRLMSTKSLKTLSGTVPEL